MKNKTYWQRRADIQPAQSLCQHHNFALAAQRKTTMVSCLVPAVVLEGVAALEDVALERLFLPVFHAAPATSLQMPSVVYR